MSMERLTSAFLKLFRYLKEKVKLFHKFDYFIGTENLVWHKY